MKVTLLKHRRKRPQQQPGTPRKKIFSYTKKTGPSLKSRLVKLKELALGAKHGPTSKCNAPRCKCCELVKGTQEFKINGKKVKASPGNCLSYNIIYLFQCSVCGKAYVGRTTRSLRVRTGEHRVKYYKLLSGDKVDETSDEYSLGLHLLDHGFKQRDDFNKIFNVSIIDNSSPKTLEVREHKYIQLLKTLKPLGINTINPFGLPLLLTS